MKGHRVKIAGYVRVSTAEQVSEGLSLEAQETKIRAWADLHDAQVVDIIREEGVSGSRLLADRPGGRTIAKLLDARKPAVDAIVVTRLDRLGRDAAEQIALLKRFRAGKVGLVAIAQHIDLATPHGRAMAQIAAVFGELERALISERTAETLEQMRADGRVTNHEPFGYQRHGDYLVPEPAEQATLARLVQLRRQQLGYLKIAAILNQEGHPTKRGGPWHASSVRKTYLHTQTRTRPHLHNQAGGGASVAG
jgi:DNA invertase Pin-like site-specific DNA recombinase